MNRKTIFILLDGCRYDTATENLGYLEHLIEAGRGRKFKVTGELPSLSRPMYETLMTGLPVCEHGITNNLITRNSNQISIFDLCRSNGLKTAASAYHWVSELYGKTPFQPLTDRIQIETDNKIQNGIYYYEDSYPDSHVFSDAEYLRNKFNPDFLFVHPMNIDDAGHKFGSNSVQYNQAVVMANILLSTAIPLWMAMGYQIVVTSDHGMNENQIHGGNSEGQRMVALYIFSDQIKIQKESERTISELYIAPILCRLLGISPSKGMKSLSEIEVDLFETEN